MPLYEYQCEACGERFEVIQKYSDPPAEVCTKCGKGPVARLVSSPAIQFKGSGWYITDYARKPSPGSTDTGKSEGTKSDGQSEGKSEGKPEGKSDSAKSDTPAKTDKT